MYVFIYHSDFNSNWTKAEGEFESRSYVYIKLDMYIVTNMCMV